MSILNVFISPDRALVGVDTEVSANGQFCECNKLLALPHINAVLGFRGALVTFMHTAMLVLGNGGTFDEMAEKLPTLIGLAIQAMRNGAPRAGLSVEFVEQAQFTFVGFSPKYGRVVAHLFEQKAGADLTITENLSGYCAPHWGDDALNLAVLGVQEDREGMKALALAQSRLVREREPSDSAAGGALVLAEVSREGIAISHLCRFPDR